MLTHITSQGDCIVEQSSDSRDGFFVVDTPRSKLIFPALDHISGSINNSILLTSSSIPSAAFELRWTDMIGKFDDSTGIAGMVFEAYTAGFQTFFFSHNQNDAFNMSFQMHHGWALTTVKPHMHVMPCAPLALNTTGTVSIGYQMTWLQVNGSWPTSWVTGSVSFLVSGSMYNVQKVISFGDMPPLVNPNASDMLLIRIMRSGTASEDTYTESKPIGTANANLMLIACDVHYQQSQAGTIFERHN